MFVSEAKLMEVAVSEGSHILEPPFFAATGKRVRQLPLSGTDLNWS